MFLAYLFVSFTVGAIMSLWLLVPVFRWQRRDGQLTTPTPPRPNSPARRALRMPTYRTLISLTNWLIGGVVFIAASWPVASHAAPVRRRGHRAWAPPRRRSSAICSPNGCCARSRWPHCAAVCRRTSTRPG